MLSILLTEVTCLISLRIVKCFKVCVFAGTVEMGIEPRSGPSQPGPWPLNQSLESSSLFLPLTLYLVMLGAYSCLCTEELLLAVHGDYMRCWIRGWLRARQTLSLYTIQP